MMFDINKDRVCIVVYGNLASGKSSFAKGLVKLLPGFKHVCMDQIRIDTYFQDPSITSLELDRKCEKICNDTLLNTRLVIYESTGVSKFFKGIIPTIESKYKMFYIYLECPAEICIRRFADRKREGYFNIPPAFSDGTNINQFINKVGSELRSVRKDLVLSSSKLSLEDECLECLEYLKCLKL